MSHRWKRLRRVSVTNPGESYQEKPTVTVSEPAAPKEPAAVTPTMDGDKIQSITVDSGGNFYNTAPDVTISPPDQMSGTQATAAAVISGGEVSAINVTDSGSGYTSPPTVTVAKSTDPKSDFGATLSLDFDSATGTVTAINVVDSGNFYDSSNPPVVTISKPFPNQNFEIGEDVNISGVNDQSAPVTMQGEVAEFVEATGKLVIIHVANDEGDFVEPNSNSIVTAPESGASSAVTKVENPDIAGDASDEFDDEASEFLDFSESNPFGEPEAATVAQEAAAITTPSSTPTEAVIQGTRSDPAFAYPKEYKIVANGVTYQYNANANNGANYFEGIRDLNVPGLTIQTYNATGIVNGIEVKYTPQVDGDTIKLAGSGWLHLGMLEGEYGVSGDRQDLSSGDSAAPQPDIEVFGTKNDPSFASGKTYTLTANGTVYSYGPTDAPGDPYNGSFYSGLRALNIPGFTITVHNQNGAINAVKLEYIKQSPTDTLTLDPNANGWAHLELLTGTYDGSSQTPSQGQGAGPGGGGQNVIDNGYMSDSDYATRVAQSSTSTVFDSAAVNLGFEKIRFESKYNFSTSDVTGSLYMPRGVTFGDNGRKLYYVSGGAYTNTQYVYGMKMHKPYDVSSINHAESAASLNLSTHFSDIFQGGYSGQYTENNMLDIWFNPQGTKMWVLGNTYSCVVQFALDSAWNLNGTITPEHKIGTGSLNKWNDGTPRLNNWTYDSNLQLINNYSNEWIDSGRTLISTGLSNRGDTIRQTFSTPYDISTCTSPGYNPNTIYRHTQYSDSDSDGAEYASDALRLAFNSGSVFNHDGSEMYFIHQQFDSANFNESGGSGLGGWRVNLVKATLDTPYDITTMAFERQAEITNLAESAGGPTHVKPSGKMAIHPAGNRFYMMTYGSQIAGTADYTDFNLWEFSTQPDSAGSPAITTPDITVKPMIQGTYVLTQDDSATVIIDSAAYSGGVGLLANMVAQNDSAKDPSFILDKDQQIDPYGNGYVYSPDRFIWQDGGKKLFTIGYDYLEQVHYYDLSTPYDMSTAVLDSSKSWNEDRRDSAIVATGMTNPELQAQYTYNNSSTGKAGSQTTLLFNGDGSKVSYYGEGWWTFDLQNNWDLSTIGPGHSHVPVPATNWTGHSPGGIQQLKWIDNGNKIVAQGGVGNIGNRRLFSVFNVPTAYDVTTVDFTDSQLIYFFGNNSGIDSADSDTWNSTPLINFRNTELVTDNSYPSILDFEFSEDGKRMWFTELDANALGRSRIYEINMRDSYDLRTQIGPTDVVMWPDNVGPDTIHGITVTPTGKLYVGYNNWGDSTATLTYDKGKIAGWDISTPAVTYGSIDEATGAAQLQPSAFGGFYTSAQWFDFNEDGTKVFVKGADPNPGYAQNGSRLGEFNLSTAYDITTFDSTPVNVEVHPDGESYEGKFGDSGNKWYATNGPLNQYNLPGPYDITNWSQSTTRNSYNNAGGNSFDFRPDGTELFAISSTSNTMGIRRYALGSPWQLNQYDNYDSQYNFDNEMTTTSGIEFNSSGTKMYVLARADANSNVGILEYDLSTAWRIGTATYNDKFLNLGNDGFMNEENLTMRLVNDNIFYVMGNNTNYYNGKAIYKYTLGAAAAATPPVVYPQQRIQNLAYDSTQELSWSTVTNEYGLEVSPDGSTIVMKDLGQNDWRVFTMSTPYDLSTAIRDTTKEPTFGMTDSAHKFKSHGMTFTSDWSKLATTRIGTPLDIYKNEISMYDITGGNSTYSLDRIDNESDGKRTSSWGTLAFEYQITDQDGTNHNQRPHNIQFGDNGQRLYWTNLTGSTNLMSQWHLSSPNTIDLDMVDSGGLYISSITGDSDILSAAINHDGTRVYALTSTGYQARGVGIYQLDLADSWDVKTATWNSDNFLKLSNNNNHGNVTAALGDIAVCEDYLFVSLTSDGSTVIRRYKIEDSTPPPPPPPTSNSDSDGLGYATAANWTITVDQGPLYEDSATQGNVFYGEAVASVSDLTFGYPPSTANRTWSGGKIRSITSLPNYYNTYQNVSSPNDLAVGDQGNFYVLDGTTTIKQFFCADSADLTNMSYLRSFTLDGTDNLSISFKRDGSQMYTVGGTSGKIKTYDLSTSWDVSTAVQDTNKTFTVPDDNNPRDFIMSPWGNGMIVLGGQNNTIYQYALDSESYDPSTAGTSYANLDIGAVTNVNGQLGISPDATKIKASHFSSYNMYIFGQDHFATIRDYIYQGTISWPGLWRKYDQANSPTSIANFGFGTMPENEEDFSDAKGFDFSFTGRTIYSIYNNNFKGLYPQKMDWPNMTFGTE